MAKPKCQALLIFVTYLARRASLRISWMLLLSPLAASVGTINPYSSPGFHGAAPWSWMCPFLVPAYIPEAKGFLPTFAFASTPERYSVKGLHHSSINSNR